MAAEWRESNIAGVLRATSTIHDDERGSFREAWRESATKPLGIGPVVQANVSISEPDVLRGLHFHERQTDLWVVVEGRAHVAAVDIRDRLGGAPGKPRSLTELLGPGDAIILPPGVAHGFWAIDRLTLLYFVTNEYDGTDEHDFAWDDVDVGVEWPPGQPTLSERDADAPSFREALARIQSAGQSSSR